MRKVLSQHCLPSLIGFCLVLALRSVNAQDTRIYIANDDHTDFMWTADADAYSKVFVEMLDWHLKLVDETAGNPAPYRHRFNCDGSYWVRTYESKKSPEEFAKLIQAIKQGSISVPLNSLASCYGGQPVEAVLRGMYYVGRLERRHDLRISMAVAMENQGLPLGLTSLFAGSGAKYSWRGVCGCATKFDFKYLSNRPHEIYWWTGHDGQRLLLKWHSLVTPGNQRSGGYSEAFDPLDAINFLDSDPVFLERYRTPGTQSPYDVRAAFGFGWDALDRKTGQPYTTDPKTYPTAEHFHVVAQRESNAKRQVIVSNESDFFEDFQSKHASGLPSESETHGNEWDLYSASMSETSARVKRSVERLRSAELLATLVSLKNPDFMVPHIPLRDQAFDSLGLYWEHNWTADGPVSRLKRAQWQDELASTMEKYVSTLQGDAIDQLGAMIPTQLNTTRFFVLNPLGWPRTQFADFEYAGQVDVGVCDLNSGLDVPHQIVTLRDRSYLRILASDIPAAGYKVFEIRFKDGPVPPSVPAAVVTGEGNSIIENDLVRVDMDRDGAIRSMIDKNRSNRELGANINGLKLNDFAANIDSGENLRVENCGPVSVTLRANSDAGLKHSTAITLYKDSGRIDIENEINSEFNDVHHWGFSFNLNSPSVRSEEVGSLNLNRLSSDGGDYSNRHARYDYITANHFVDFTDGSNSNGVVLSNADLAFAKLGISTPTMLDSTTPQVSLLAGGQVDGPTLGIPSQNTNTRFLQRFALHAHDKYDATFAMKFALEHQNPLVTGAVVGSEQTPFPEKQLAFVKVSNPNVLLWALKPHEDGIKRGLVARLWNVVERSALSNLSFSTDIVDASRCTHIETDLEPIRLSESGSMPLQFSRQQLQTYRIRLK
jgi:alpha-mannosidase